MSTGDEIDEDVPVKRSKLPLVLGLILSAMGGVGGFWVMYSELIPGTEASEISPIFDEPTKLLPDVAFVALDPMVISLGNGGANTHLRFRAQLEVPSRRTAEVEAILPRIVDVLNSYLRAVDRAELADNFSLARLRAQMLRRVQVVAGKGNVRDLLVMEFVLN